MSKSKLIAKAVSEVIKNSRADALKNETQGVARMVFNPKITGDSMFHSFRKMRGNLRLSTLPLSSIYGDHKILGKAIKETLGDNTDNIVSVPQMSKDLDIKPFSEEFLDAKRNMKNFVQSKFYNKLLKRAHVPRKDIIQGAEEAMDSSNFYLVDRVGSDISGTAHPGTVTVSYRFLKDPSPNNLLHELTHEAFQLGTPKHKFFDASFTNSAQGKLLQRNRPLFGYYRKDLRKALEDMLVKNNSGRPLTSEQIDWVNYFLKDEELQANLRPLQMLMVERGWQPNQMYRLIKDRNIPLSEGTRTIVDALNKNGLADIMSNMLKNGGKLNEKR